jgi:hypothetical protein
MAAWRESGHRVPTLSHLRNPAALDRAMIFPFQSDLSPKGLFRVGLAQNVLAFCNRQSRDDWRKNLSSLIANHRRKMLNKNGQSASIKCAHKSV